MTSKETCPLCQSSLRGKAIPEEYLRAGHYGAWDGTIQYYSRLIGVEEPRVYDGVLYWMCPDCGGKWHRWPEGHHLRDRAAKWVEGKPDEG